MSPTVTPPNILGVQNNGVAGLIIATGMSFEDTVSFYENALGATGVSDGDDIVISAQFEEATWFVLIQELEDGMTLVVIQRF